MRQRTRPVKLRAVNRLGPASYPRDSVPTIAGPGPRQPAKQQLPNPDTRRLRGSLAPAPGLNQPQRCGRLNPPRPASRCRLEESGSPKLAGIGPATLRRPDRRCRRASGTLLNAFARAFFAARSTNRYFLTAASNYYPGNLPARGRCHDRHDHQYPRRYSQGL